VGRHAVASTTPTSPTSSSTYTATIAISGYRFVADELDALGHPTCERRVWRLCSQQRIWSTTTKKGRRSTGKEPGPAVHDDLVQRDFTAPAPDWCG
jgi:hypothetical protein